MDLSIVVPVYNEEKNITELHRRIVAVLKEHKYSYEIIFIDDGSTDASAAIAQKLSPLTLIRFRRNFGQTAAFDAGFKAVQGKYVVTLDADLQNDPADIPAMLEYLKKNNLDVVSGWRKDRHDPLLKRIVSKGAHILRRAIINDGIHDSGCSLKVYRRDALQGLSLYGEMHRFIPALLKIKGYRIGEMVVQHHPRVAGVSKYGVTRMIKGILDMYGVWFWKKYANRPLHLFGTMGFVLMVISIAAGAFALYEKIFLGQDLSNTFLTQLSMFGFLMGVQFIIFGLLADILSKIYFSEVQDTPYSIAEKIVND